MVPTNRPRWSRLRWTATAIAAAVASASVATGSAAAADLASNETSAHIVASRTPGTSPSGADCEDIFFNVSQFEGSPANERVYGQFCHRGELTSSTPVQVLIHGGSYNHAYWDWPYKPEVYSYVKAATDRGYATLNFDRLGAGQSTHPIALTLDFKVAGYVTHQLVQALRGGALGPKFQTVVLNGHSMGGLTAEREASTYNDVNAIIVTGVGHGFDLKGISRVADKFYPANIDPKFANKGLIPGYLTSIPGNRVDTFVKPADYDPEMATYEERLKDTISPTEITAITLDSYDPSITENIKVPVLYALGQHDGLWCPTTDDCNTDPQAQSEKNYYQPGLYTLYIVPGSAHSVNVTKAAPNFYHETFRWLNTRVLHH